MCCCSLVQVRCSSSCPPLGGGGDKSDLEVSQSIHDRRVQYTVVGVVGGRGRVVDASTRTHVTALYITTEASTAERMPTESSGSRQCAWASTPRCSAGTRQCRPCSCRTTSSSHGSCRPVSPVERPTSQRTPARTGAVKFHEALIRAPDVDQVPFQCTEHVRVVHQC